MKREKFIVLSNVKSELSTKDKILLFILRRYTYTIYKIGFEHGFNWRD